MKTTTARLRWKLNKVGVELLDRSRMVLRCRECGQRWSPNVQPGGRLPRGYWRCPRGCNQPAVTKG